MDIKYKLHKILCFRFFYRYVSFGEDNRCTKLQSYTKYESTLRAVCWKSHTVFVRWKSFLSTVMRKWWNDDDVQKRQRTAIIINWNSLASRRRVFIVIMYIFAFHKSAPLSLSLAHIFSQLWVFLFTNVAIFFCYVETLFW